MGDDFAELSRYWALAARLLHRGKLDEEDAWELEIHEDPVLHMTYHRFGGSASARVELMDLDGNRGEWQPRDFEDVQRDLHWAVERLPDLAAKASLV